MKLKLVLFALTSIAIGMSFVPRTQAREAYFDTICDGCDDADVYDSTAAAGDNPLYHMAMSIRLGKAINTKPLTGTANRYQELSFDVSYTGDDDTSDLSFAMSRGTNGPVTVSLRGVVVTAIDTFGAKVSLADPTGVAPPVLFSFAGQLAPGLSFASNGQPPVQQLLTTDGFSLHFDFDGPSAGSALLPVFSSFTLSAEVVPEPSTVLLAILGSAATWQMARTRRRAKPH